MEYQTAQLAIAHNFRTWCVKNVVAEGIDLTDSLAKSDDAGRTVNPNAYYVIIKLFKHGLHCKLQQLKLQDHDIPMFSLFSTQNSTINLLKAHDLSDLAYFAAILYENLQTLLDYATLMNTDSPHLNVSTWTFRGLQALNPFWHHSHDDFQTILRHRRGLDM
jgi:hypothetical protein